jgi:hypothetical protein
MILAVWSALARGEEEAGVLQERLVGENLRAVSLGELAAFGHDNGFVRPYSREFDAVRG